MVTERRAFAKQQYLPPLLPDTLYIWTRLGLLAPLSSSPFEGSVAFTPFTLNERASEGGADTKDMLAASESEQARQAKKTTFGTSINDVRKMFHLLDPPFPLVHMLLITSPHF